jgi:hypothetical protein
MLATGKKPAQNAVSGDDKDEWHCKVEIRHVANERSAQGAHAISNHQAVQRWRPAVSGEQSVRPSPADTTALQSR